MSARDTHHMKTNASWGGRFSEGPKEAVAAYTESESYDRAMAFQDIRASKAHAHMLARQGVLTPEDGEALEKGLDMVAEEISRGEFTWKPELEDVHMNIEARLTQLVGEVGKRLHTGRSRNDQVALDIKLWCKQEITSFRLFPGSRNIVQNPFDLRCGKICVDYKSGLGPEFFCQSLLYKIIAILRRSAALPDDCIIYRFPGCLIPDNCSFSLICDSNAHDILWFNIMSLK